MQKKFKYPDGTVMPKRASQAYQIYVKENKDKIIEKNKCTNEEAKQICDQVWNKLTEKQKTKYDNLHEKDVKRYEKQIIQVQTKGYFVQEDGTRSQWSINYVFDLPSLFFIKLISRLKID